MLDNPQSNTARPPDAGALFKPETRLGGCVNVPRPKWQAEATAPRVNVRLAQARVPQLGLWTPEPAPADTQRHGPQQNAGHV